MAPAERTQKILIAEPEPSISEALKEFLLHVGYQAEIAMSREDIVATAVEQRYGVVILDHLLNSSGDGDILEELRAAGPSICIIMLISYPLVEYVIAAYRKGVFDVVIKPVDLFELDEIIQRAFRQHELNRACQFVSENRERIDELIADGDFVSTGQPHQTTL
jgi:DNA-binding NtrC family response regulator